MKDVNKSLGLVLIFIVKRSGNEAMFFVCYFKSCLARIKKANRNVVMKIFALVRNIFQIFRIKGIDVTTKPVRYILIVVIVVRKVIFIVIRSRRDVSRIIVVIIERSRTIMCVWLGIQNEWVVRKIIQIKRKRFIKNITIIGRKIKKEISITTVVGVGLWGKQFLYPIG